MVSKEIQEMVNDGSCPLEKNFEILESKVNDIYVVRLPIGKYLGEIFTDVQHNGENYAFSGHKPTDLSFRLYKVLHYKPITERNVATLQEIREPGKVWDVWVPYNVRTRLKTGTYLNDLDED